MEYFLFSYRPALLWLPLEQIVLDRNLGYVEWQLTHVVAQTEYLQGVVLRKKSVVIPKHHQVAVEVVLSHQSLIPDIPIRHR